jgi:hypothetical protein
MTRLASVSLLPACFALACDPRADKQARPGTPQPTHAALTGVTSPSPNPSAEARPHAPQNAWTGHWSGVAAVRKTELVLPGKRSMQAAWSKDPGTAHVGRALLDCRVEPSGQARCELRSEDNSQAGPGQLPQLKLSGLWDDPKSIAAEVEAQAAPPALTELSSGTLQGTLKTADEAVGTLRLASGDSMLLRSGSFELKRQPLGAPSPSPSSTEATTTQ